MPRILLCALIGGAIMSAQIASALTGEVRTVGGTPILLINGKPASPLMFYGSVGAVAVGVTTEWRKLEGTFVAPETTDHAAIHFHFGQSPKVLWLDDIQLREGAPGSGKPNLARFGDFEGALNDFEREWELFTRPDLGAEAKASIDDTTAMSGNKSLRIDVTGGGTAMWHAHIYQENQGLIAGRTYTFSAWAKADRPSKMEMWVVEQGGDWTTYGVVGDSPILDEVKRAASAGVRIYSFGVPLGVYREGMEPDFTGTDEWIDRVLEANPDGLIIPRLWMEPRGGWWDESSPDEFMLYDDGTRGYPSVASHKWREGAAKALRATVRHLEAKYGEHMLGYHPSGQNSGEWFYDRSWDGPMNCYEKVMSDGFREWAGERYRGDLQALRRAWRERTASFDDIVVPTREERTRARLGAFRDPRRERKLVDFYEYIQIAMVEPLEDFARIIKEETGRRKLVLYFYGYLYDMAGIPNGPQTSGHLALARMLRCPDVDILCSPISYFDRDLVGSGPFMAPIESVQAHGKLWLDEDDTRTYLTTPADNYGRVATPQHTFWVHQRNFAQYFTRRMACWWMDLAGTGWLDAADIWQNLGALTRHYDANLTPRPQVAQIAVVMDEKSWFYAACDRSISWPLVYDMRQALYRMGAPFGQCLLSDLVAGRVPPAKMYVFLDCFALTDAERTAVGDATRRAGTTAVWMYGSGFINKDASAGNTTALTGFDFSEGVPGETKVAFESAPDDLLRNVSAEMILAPAPSPALRPVANKGGAEVLARFQPSGDPAIAVQRGKHTSVYVGCTMVPAQLLRNLAAQAGAHIYLDSDDVLITDGRFLAVHASQAGQKTIRLPAKATVRDALSGETVAEGVEAITLEMGLGETRMYELGR